MYDGKLINKLVTTVDGVLECVTLECPCCNDGEVARVTDYSTCGEHQQHIDFSKCAVCNGTAKVTFPKDQADELYAKLEAL